MGTAAAVKSALLWAIVLTAPTAWAVTLLANYLLTARACGAALGPLFPLIAVAMLTVIAATSVVALRIRRAAVRHEASDESEEPSGTTHFMANLTLLGCALFAIAIVAQAVTPWILHDCV